MRVSVCVCACARVCACVCLCEKLGYLLKHAVGRVLLEGHELTSADTDSNVTVYFRMGGFRCQWLR
jgi:hypothetical protein